MIYFDTNGFWNPCIIFHNIRFHEIFENTCCFFEKFLWVILLSKVWEIYCLEHFSVQNASNLYNKHLSTDFCYLSYYILN